MNDSKEQNEGYLRNFKKIPTKVNISFKEIFHCTTPELNEIKSFQKIIFENMQKESLLQDSSPVEEIQNNFSIEINQQFINVYKELTNNLLNSFASYFANFTQIEVKLQVCVAKLAEDNWFLDIDISEEDFNNIKDVIMTDNNSEVDRTMLIYFENNLNRIKDRLIEQFPNRNELFDAAFTAHCQGKFILAIPVFLSQTDGICFDTFQNCYFQKFGHKPKLASTFEYLAQGEFMKALVYPMMNTLPISSSKNEREKGYSGLNRHMVLHGESIDYGTKKNSYKAISLLNYIAGAISLTK